MKSIVRKMLLGFIAVCVILTGVAYFTYLNMSKLVNRTNQDDYSLSILKNIENIHMNTLDIETGMRGYLIVGDTIYLRPLKRGKSFIFNNLDTLVILTNKYNKHIVDAEELKEYCQLLVEVSDVLVKDESFHKTDSAKRIGLLYKSKRYMDGIRAIITGIEQEERLILRQTANENVKKATITKYGFATTALLSILILITVFIIVRKELRARFEAENKLQLSSDRVFDLYNNAPCGYHSIGDNNLFVEINDVELSWTGYTREEVIGKMTIYDFLIPEDHYKIQSFLKELKLGLSSSIKDLEVKYRRKDGSTFDAILNSTILFNDKGKSTRSRTVVLDNSEIKKSQAKINLLNQELENNNLQLVKANEELESFSYSVSHDLRAPLRAIDGYCEILREDYEQNLDHEGKRVLNVIVQNTKRMGVLIDDLLDFSRLGRKVMRMAEVNQNAVIEELISELNIDKNTSINIELLHNCLADRSLMKQIWQNLLSNSLKYSSKNMKPCIRISSYINNTEIVYCIEDNGVGFDEKYKHKLFQVFQRLHHDDEYEGTGVGLAIVHRIVAKHKGNVWAESTPNLSTKFYFSIPINRS